MNDTKQNQIVNVPLNAVASFSILLIILGTIIVTVGVSVVFGWAWGLMILGALVIVYGLILGFSV